MVDPLPDIPRIYLDNAATSWPKPESVYRAVDDYQRRLGAPAGRSSYAEAAEVSARVDSARRQVASLVGCRDSSHLIFTGNGTDSLNLVLHGLLRRGDHVVATDAEHNSVLRPLTALADQGVTATYVACSPEGYVDPDDVHAALTPATRLVAITHASNVTGAIQPVKEIALVAHEHDALILCDAAQTLGHLAFNMESLGVDFLAAPGHKGLLGPLGTGILAIAPRMAQHLSSIRQGGTGTQSESAEQPNELPAKFESGNLNVPGILGLAAGVEYLLSRGLTTIESETAELTKRLLDGLATIGGVKLFGPPGGSSRVPLVSLHVEGYDPQELAVLLDTAYRVQVRAGLHCAPRMHAALGTETNGGTVRLSLGPFNTLAHVDATVEALAELAGTSLPA